MANISIQPVSGNAAPAEDPWAAYPLVTPSTPAPRGQGIPATGMPSPDADPWAAYPLVEKGGVAEDVVRSIPSGLASGAAGLAGLPDLVAEWGAKGIDLAAQGGVGVYNWARGENHAVERPAPKPAGSWGLPSTEAAQREIAAVVPGADYQPKTRAGKFAHTASSFIPGGALGPVGAAGRAAGIARNAAAYGVVPGLASEAAGQAFEGSAAETPARIIAGVGTGLGMAAARRVPNADKMVRGKLDDVSAAELDAMEDIFQRAQQQGMPISRAEALQAVTNGRTRLGDLQHTVEGQGGLRDFYAARPGQNAAAAERAFDDIIPQPMEASRIGPAVGREAEGVVNRTRDVINTASEPFYDAAALTRIPAADMARVRQVPGYDIAVRRIRNDPQLARYVDGLPEDSVGFIGEVKKHLDTAAEQAGVVATGRANRQRAAGFASDAEIMRDTASRASPAYRTALDIQRQGRERFLDPLLNGPIGRLANRDQPTAQAIEALFPTAPLPNSAAEIGSAVGQLAARNPTAARSLVRAHVESTFDEAAQRLATGPSQTGGAKFAAVLRGNDQQAANLEAAVRALPNGDTTWVGFNRFLEVMEAQQFRKTGGSDTAFKQVGVQDLNAGGAANAVVQVGASGGLNLPKKVGQAFDRWNTWRNLDQIADLLTNPQAARAFRDIAEAPTTGSKVGALALRLALIGIESRNDRPAHAGKGKL